MDFTANGLPVGQGGSEVKLDAPGKVHLSAKVAALLPEIPTRGLPPPNQPAQKPYWSIDRARLGDTRTVSVEVLVNGIAVAKQVIVADGTQRDMAFDVPIERSSWVALRILPSSHTNPIFVVVDGKPIRPSRRSVEWCLASVVQCWQQKEKFIAPAELEEARAAYAHARESYFTRIAESFAD